MTVQLSKAPAAGDVLLFFFESNKAIANWPATSGWTSDASTATMTHVMHHVVKAGESGTYAINVGGSGHGWASYMVAEVAGASTTNPINTAPAKTYPKGTSSYAFNGYPNAAGTFPVAFLTPHASGQTWSSISSGWTIADRNQNFSEAVAFGSVQAGTAPLSGSATLSSASSYGGAVDLVMLNPASDPPVTSSPSPAPPVQSSPSPPPVSASPTPVSVAAGSAPRHIETWAGYCYGQNEGCGSSAATVQKWVSYAEGVVGATTGACDTAGHPCNSVEYTDETNIYSSCTGEPVSLSSGSESWWLHNSSGSRISKTAGCGRGGTVNFINHLSVTGALPALNAYYNRQSGASLVDVRFNDDTGSIDQYASQTPVEYPVTSGSGGTSFSSTQIAAHENWMSHETKPNGNPINVIFNGCDSNSYQDSGTEMIKAYPNILGCVSEGGTWSAANGGPGWAPGSTGGRIPYTLDMMARVVNNPSGGMWVAGPETDTADAPGSAGQQRARRVVTAMIWLAYQPGRVIDWEELEYGSSHVNVFPEEGIYPTSPIQSMTTPGGCPVHAGGTCSSGGHNIVQVAPGVFRREFAECYNQGVAFGRCAVIFNATASAVTRQASWLTQTYTRAVSMSGGVIDDGGSINVTGASAGSTIPAEDAVLLTQ